MSPCAPTRPAWYSSHAAGRSRRRAARCRPRAQLRESGSADAYAYPCQFPLICPGCGREFPGTGHYPVTSSPVHRSQRRWVMQSDGTPHTGYGKGS
jgi:hypothetical protein